jgi:fermentation-respiration switch protein FrsA (DUF1100 family)
MPPGRARSSPSESPAAELRGAHREPDGGGAERVLLDTSAGPIECRLHDARPGASAVLWVFGAGGGLGGPAGGVYARLGRQLASEGIASLELAYRRPGALRDCVYDALLGIAYLGTLGRTRIVLVGHSFGGAVVITGGAISREVVAVAALSSQTYGTEAVPKLSPRPLLVVHGQADEVLADGCARDIFRRAGEPKRLVLYPGCGHGLDECREALDRDLLGWLRQVTQAAPPSAETALPGP